jgi:HSP20 family protein
MFQKATATQSALSPAPAVTIEPQEPQSLFGEFDRIYQSIAKRAFEIFETSGKGFGHDLDDWFKAESELLHPVKINMSETDNAMVLQAEVPGFAAKDIEIRLEPRRLTISGKRVTSEEKKKGNAIYQEHASNEMLRVMEFPVDVGSENATATLRNGILELQLSKSATERAFKPVRLEVKAA